MRQGEEDAFRPFLVAVAPSHPIFLGFGALAVVVGGVLGLLGDPRGWFLVFIGVVAAALTASQGISRYECGLESFRIVRWWGRNRTVALSDLEGVSRQPTSGLEPTAIVKFKNFPKVYLYLKWPDHQALADHLERRLPEREPVPLYDEVQGTIAIDALAGLSSPHCLRCGSTTFVRPIRVVSHHGIHLGFMSVTVRRHFMLPVCVWHRWGRRAATLLAVATVPVVFVFAIVLAGSAPDWAGSDAMVTFARYAIGAATLGWLFAILNDLHRYVLDRWILGVRLGWLSRDYARSRIVMASDRAREAILEHLKRGRRAAPLGIDAIATVI